jgi:hypothetical protein
MLWTNYRSPQKKRQLSSSEIAGSPAAHAERLSRPDYRRHMQRRKQLAMLPSRTTKATRFNSCPCGARLSQQANSGPRHEARNQHLK